MLAFFVQVSPELKKRAWKPEKENSIQANWEALSGAFWLVSCSDAILACSFCVLEDGWPYSLFLSVAFILDFIVNVGVAATKKNRWIVSKRLLVQEGLRNQHE